MCGAVSSTFSLRLSDTNIIQEYQLLFCCRRRGQNDNTQLTKGRTKLLLLYIELIYCAKIPVLFQAVDMQLTDLIPVLGNVRSKR